MPIAALYCRVSSTAQVHADPWASLTRQADDLRALAARMGFAIAFVVEEQGSGAKADRPGWARVLAAVRAREVDVILAVAFDRLTRSERIGEWEDLKGELRAARARLVTIKQGEIDLSGSADAETRSDIDAVLSKRERLVIRQRTMDGRRAKALAGEYTGSPVPYGYVVTFDPATGAKVFLIDESKAQVVRRIFDAYLAGQGYNGIARALNEELIPSPRGREWSKGSVQNILSQALYAGVLEVRKARQARQAPNGPPTATVPSAAFPAILPVSVLADVRAARDKRRREPMQHTGVVHPLTGILKCCGCGRGMNSVPNNGYPAYRCGSISSQPGTCPAPSLLNAREAERVVREALVRKIGRFLARPARIVADPPPDQAAEADAIRRRIVALEAEETALARQLGQDVITLEVFRRAQAGIASDLATCRGQLVHLELDTTSKPAAPAPANLMAVRDALQLPGIDASDLRALFAGTIAAVTIEVTGRQRKVGGAQVQVVRSLDLTPGFT